MSGVQSNRNPNSYFAKINLLMRFSPTLTFPWLVSKSPTFPDFPDKWSAPEFRYRAYTGDRTTAWRAAGVSRHCAVLGRRPDGRHDVLEPLIGYAACSLYEFTNDSVNVRTEVLQGGSHSVCIKPHRHDLGDYVVAYRWRVGCGSGLKLDWIVVQKLQT